LGSFSSTRSFRYSFVPEVGRSLLRFLPLSLSPLQPVRTASRKARSTTNGHRFILSPYLFPNEQTRTGLRLLGRSLCNAKGAGHAHAWPAPSRGWSAKRRLLCLLPFFLLGRLLSLA